MRAGGVHPTRTLMGQRDKREALLEFLDQRAFEPVLDASPDDYTHEVDKRMLEDVKERTRREQRRYHDEYASAGDIRKSYLSDVSSSAAKKVHRELEQLNLPTLPKLKGEFLDLCARLGV